MMIETLLTLALALLVAAQQPNVPETLKIQAISVAQNAISYAIRQEPAKLTQDTSQPVGVIPATPDAGNHGISMKMTQKSIEVAGANCAQARYKLAFVDESGNFVRGKQITMIAPEDTQTKITDDFVEFIYTPRATSTIQTIEFHGETQKITTELRILDGLQHAQLRFDGEHWHEITGGVRVNKDTMQCI